MSKKRDKDIEIRELKKENKRLKKENFALCDELYSLKKRASLDEKKGRLSFEAVRRRAELFERKSFASYLVGSFKFKSLFAFYQRLVFIVRKYTLITTTLKILTFIFGVLQSGALIVLFTGTVAVTLPLTLIFSYTAAVFSFIFRKRLTARAKEVLSGKDVTVFFPPRNRAFETSSYFRGFALDAAKDSDTLAVIVTPYALSPVGILERKKFFFSVRRESERIIIMRPHYFFTFKKKILAEHDKNITFIF